MCAIELQYPLGSYSIDNPPSNETLKSDLVSVQVAVNAGEDAIATKQDAATAATLAGTQILTNKTLTNPTINSMQYNGWNTLPALAWVSTDGSTNVVNATGDMTSTLSPGMRVKTQQAQALTAYWPMDANSNTTVGSFNGTDTDITYTAGKFSNAATFDGTTSKIVIADNASLKPTGEFTLGCWFKTGTTGVAKSLFASYSDNTNSNGIIIYITSSNVLSFVIGNNAANVSTDLTGATVVTDNAWHYVAISSRNNYTQVYLDGKLESSGYSVTPTYAATNYVRVGCWNLTGADALFMNGQIDDLFLINGYALDEKTIKAKYDAQTAQGTGNITVDKYALITAVAPYAAGVTPITIWGGTDYSLANATISSPYYATVSQPFGFPQKLLSNILGYIEVTSNQTGITTVVDLAGLTIRVNVPAGINKIKISTQVLPTSSVANDLFGIQIAEGATVYQSANAAFVTGGNTVSATAILPASIATPGYHTYKITLQRVSGTGTITNNAAAAFPSFILVEKE